MSELEKASLQALELRQLAEKFSEVWRYGIKIDSNDVMLLLNVADALEQKAEPVVEPPQRRSLTERECRAMWQASDFRGNGGQRDWFIAGIRAAEVAHDITAKQAEPHKRAIVEPEGSGFWQYR